MKIKRIMIMVAVFVFCSGAYGHCAVKRYQLKSGIIKYRISGSNKGTEELYFDDWGNKEARYTDTSMSVMGFTQTVKTAHIIDGEWAYDVDFKTNTATRINYKEMMNAMMKNKNGQMGFSKDMIDAFKGKKVGTEKILGKNCTIWEIPDVGSRVWEWQGIPLKTAVNMMGFEYVMTAVEVKENTRIDQAKLRLPPNVKIEDAPDVDITDLDEEEMRKGMAAMKEMQASPEFQEYQQAMKDMREKRASRRDSGEVEDEANDPLSQATQKGVEEAIGSVFGSLFGD